MDMWPYLRRKDIHMGPYYRIKGLAWTSEFCSLAQFNLFHSILLGSSEIVSVYEYSSVSISIHSGSHVCHWEDILFFSLHIWPSMPSRCHIYCIRRILKPSLCLCLLGVGSHNPALTILELTVYTRLGLNSERSICLCLPIAGTNGCTTTFPIPW